MAENWYYVQGGTRHGPVTHEALQGLLSAGTLLPTDSVWKEGMSGWEMAGKVPGLMPPPPASPPPVAAPPISAPPVATPGGTAIPATPGVTTTKVLPPIDTNLRRWVIICSAALLVAFFVPYFYIWSKTYIGVIPPATADDPIRRSALPFGWSFWWNILIFVFAWFALAGGILDLVLKIGIVRAITKWVFIGVFAVATLLPLIHVPLAIFGIGVGGITLYTDADPDGYTYSEIVDGTRAGSLAGRSPLVGLNDRIKKLRDGAAEGTPEQKANAKKAQADTYATLTSIPIGSLVTLAAGAVGLWVALQIVQKKK
jgi:hypothetical protein